MATTATLTWTPAAGATSQLVQYKLATASTWTTFGSALSGTANTATITGLADNQIYNFQVVTECSGGTPKESNMDTKIKLTCPNITTTKTTTSISYSFPELGGSVTSYTVKLYSAAGAEITSQTPTGTTTRSGSFTGLTAETTYKIGVIVTAGTFSKSDCAQVTITTDAETACNAPTSLTATVS